MLILGWWSLHLAGNTNAKCEMSNTKSNKGPMQTCSSMEHVAYSTPHMIHMIQPTSHTHMTAAASDVSCDSLQKKELNHTYHSNEGTIPATAKLYDKAAMPGLSILPYQQISDNKSDTHHVAHTHTHTWLDNHC